MSKGFLKEFNWNKKLSKDFLSETQTQALVKKTRPIGAAHPRIPHILEYTCLFPFSEQYTEDFWSKTCFFLKNSRIYPKYVLIFRFWLILFRKWMFLYIFCIKIETIMTLWLKAFLRLYTVLNNKLNEALEVRSHQKNDNKRKIIRLLTVCLDLPSQL